MELSLDPLRLLENDLQGLRASPPNLVVARAPSIGSRQANGRWNPGWHFGCTFPSGAIRADGKERRT